MPSLARAQRWPALALLAVACGGVAEDPWVPPPGWDRTPRPDLAVTVVDVDGAPVTGAWVSLSPGGREAQADATGTALLAELPAGTYIVRAGKPGYAPGEGSVVVDEDASVDLVLSATAPPPELVLHVYGPSGAPVERALVSLDGADLGETGGDGVLVHSAVTTGRHDLLVSGAAIGLGDWSTAQLDLLAGGTVRVEIGLPGAVPEKARPIGSDSCGACHTAEHAAWQQTAHARAGRVPAEVGVAAGTPGEGFGEGRTVSLDATVPGASVQLGATGDAWWAVVRDGSGNATAALPVVEVYGGHGPGAAFSVTSGGLRQVLPVAWAAEGQGGVADPSDYVPAWTDGWFSGDTLQSPGNAARFDLQCAGCHATGAALSASGGYHLVDATADAVSERVVGCEACHGYGSVHRASPSERRDVLVHPARLDPEAAVGVCARCHAQVSANAHPFADEPGWPVDDLGRLPGPAEFAAATEPNRQTFTAIPSSQVWADQAGELLASPHHDGPSGYLGTCSDCHDPHGSGFAADLRTAPDDNALCVSCHLALQSTDDQRDHAGHEGFAPDEPFGPGRCTSCHMPRTAVSVRRDAVSGVGELRSHWLVAYWPEDVLADFDALGADHLLPGEVAVPGCLDCHLQEQARLLEEDDVCACPRGDPYLRRTYESLGVLMDERWEAP